MKRRLTGLVVLAVVVVVILLVIREQSDPDIASQQSTSPQPISTNTASTRAQGSHRPAASPDSTQADTIIIPGDDVSDPSARKQAVAKLDETILLYRTTMEYPLWSRPADASTDHVTHWNHAVSIGQPFAVDAAKREIAASATIDRLFAAPGDAVTLQVAGSYVDDGSPAPLDQVHAQLQWYDRPNNAWILVQEVPLAPRAGSWAGSVTPSQVAALKTPREARLVAFVQLGEFSRELPLDFAYTASPPVVILGIASERVADGQLEIGLDVNITDVATIGLNATLFAADGITAIAVFDDRYFPTRTGHQVIPVKFFGKILHDRKIDGPYRVGAIHGYVYQRDVPDVRFDRPDAPALVTLAHRATEFSAASYHDPAVDARLAQYQAMRGGLDDGEPPRSPPTP